MTPKIATAVSNYLNRKGYNTPYINYFEKIQEYLSWYRGDTNWHSYRFWNGKKRLSRRRYSLDMAKTACEDMASLIGVEKIELTFDDPKAEEFVNEVLKANDFRVNAPQLFELMFALGTCSFVASVQDENIVIDYIHGDMIFPLKWDNGKITECAFATVGGEDDKVAYTVIFYTKDENGNYVIKKVELNGDGESINQQDIDDAEAIETGTDVPQFAVCKTNIVNNYDKTSPLGMSVFGNAINVLKSIDETFDGIHNEFKQGKKRIFIKSGLQSVRIEEDPTRENRIYDQIDSNDVEFYQIDWTGEHQDKPPIYESNMTLRVGEYQQGMEMLLNMFSKKVGLGENYYTFEKGAVQTTATAVISAKSDLFRNIRKQELAVESALIGLCRAILDLANRNLGTAFDINQNITVNFDDSIIEDTEKTQQEAMAEYNAGLIDQVEYIAMTRKMTREQAEKFIAEMKATDTMKEVESLLNNNNFGEF